MPSKTQSNIEKAVAKLREAGLNISISNDDVEWADSTGQITVKVSGVDMIVATRFCKSVAATKRAILQALQTKLLVANSYMERDLSM